MCTSLVRCWRSPSPPDGRKPSREVRHPSRGPPFAAVCIHILSGTPRAASAGWAAGRRSAGPPRPPPTSERPARRGVCSGRARRGRPSASTSTLTPAWPVALFPITPVGMPIDDPGLDPLWARAVEYDLAVLVHPFNLSNPRSPGLADLWDNVFLERAAGGVWAGMRAVAAITGSGMLDRFPAMRVGVVETGHGWLASWAFHLDEVPEMTEYAIAHLSRR